MTATVVACHDGSENSGTAGTTLPFAPSAP